MAGYSGTPLPQKLGLKPGARLGTLAAPKNFNATLGPLPHGVTVTDATRGASELDVILCFAESCAALHKLFRRAHGRLEPSGGLWVCWPKKASGVATDVTEASVRRLGLDAGLVDNKVCAIDEVWSGLRMVVRVSDRPKATRSPPTRSAPLGVSRRVPAKSKTSRKTATASAPRSKKL
jgi:hypothetical protein